MKMKRVRIELDSHLRSDVEFPLDRQCDESERIHFASLRSPIWEEVFSPIANKLRLQIYHPLHEQLQERFNK